MGERYVMSFSIYPLGTRARISLPNPKPRKTDIARAGPLYFQSQDREIITEHFQREKAAGHEIWPAKRDVPADETTDMDMEICRSLECKAQKEVLAW
jgi:hypothetical protein